jgi:hypothetical protein
MALFSGFVVGNNKKMQVRQYKKKKPLGKAALRLESR